MAEELKIRLDTDAKDSRNFNFLREKGVSVIQHVAPESWTDHNLHDPGITMLEALSYAFTELGALNDFDMSELLTAGEVNAPQEFFTAAEVLPSAPVSLRDFQKIMIDHPLINRSWVSASFGDPGGQLSVLLEFEKMELNSNVIHDKVTVAAKDFNIDIVFPYWDDPDIAALQADVNITSASFVPAANPWQPIAGSDAFFNRIRIDYFDGVPKNIETWIVLLVTTPVTEPIANILNAASAILLLTGSNSIIKQYNRRVTEAFEASRHVRRYAKNYRNLAENITAYQAVRIQEVAFTANIEVGPDVDVETLLANIFFAVDRYISSEVETFSLAEMQRKGIETADIFEGPLLNYGFIPEEELTNSLPLNKFYVSDIIRLIIQLRNSEGTDIQTREELINRSIIAINNVSLALYLDNRPIVSGAADCLQLINSPRHIPNLSVQKCSVKFRRNNVEVVYDLNKVVALFSEKKNLATAKAVAAMPDLPIPTGTGYPITYYYPVQNNLPVTYGVGEAGLPATASLERKAQAKQLKGYLFFFEQMLAGHFAHLAQINAFFSAKPDITTTLSQQTLYHLPEVASLFGFNVASPLWEFFQLDENNTYRQVLRNDVETREQFLDRRQRMLDHLLARLGEDMQDYSALSFRQSYLLPFSPTDPISQLLDAQQKKYQEISRRLLKDKASFFYDLPWLNRSRGQAFGVPSWRRKNMITVTKVPAFPNDKFEWTLKGFSDIPLLRQAVQESTEAEARRKAEEVLTRATSLDSYSTFADGAVFRVRIRLDNLSSDDAVSIDSFGTSGAATTAIPVIREEILRAWLEFALASLEARMYHLLGFTIKGERHKLVNPITDHFEIFDDAFLQKRFRLRATTNPASAVLLESQISYPGTNQALDAINEVIRDGIKAENYFIEPLFAPFKVILKRPDASILATDPANYSTIQLAEQAANRIREHLYRLYSVEGFYMVENMLLYPPPGATSHLLIDDIIDHCQLVQVPRTDPYSFQITFVFPSGYARDFNAPPPIVRTEIFPDRFRDREFRDYAERTIRKACPAHILPLVVWADRALPGTVIPPNVACFDLFENTYRQWLTAFFTDEVPAATIEPLRITMVDIMNRLFEVS
jgi:hypothetical protein